MFKTQNSLRTFSIILALCVTLSMSIPTSAQAGGNGKSPFTSQSRQCDDKKSDSAERERGFTQKTVATMYMIQSGIIHGNANGEFTMTSKIKRGDFIIMLIRAFKLKATSKVNFKDVLKYCYYYDAVVAAKALGITNGDGKGNFMGEKYITVKDAMTLIERAAKIASPSVKLSANTNLATAFATLTPASYATREQVSQMLYYVLTGKTDGATVVKPGTSSGSDGKDVTGTAKYTLNNGTDTLTNGIISAADPNLSSIKVGNKAALTVSGYTITKTGDTTSADSSILNGLNSAVLATSAGTIVMSNSTVITDAKGANAIFSTGDKTTVTVKNTVISTKAAASRGLSATSSGTIVADTVDITTAGSNSAAVATGHSGGTVTVMNASLKTAGTDSPGIYSTGNITVSGSTVTAAGSEAVVVEGKSTITFVNTVLSAFKKFGVKLYQSASGDASAGTASFTMTSGSLSAAEGPLFYITNTAASINLSGATLSSASGILLQASADQWGKTGSNGGSVALTADNQKLTGSILCDSVSTVAVALKNGTALAGAVNAANAGGKVSVSLDLTSKWVVTGTSYISGLTDADMTLSNIDDNGNTIYYKVGDSANSWLKGATYPLQDGGTLKPIF